MTSLEARFTDDLLSNRSNRALLERWHRLALPDAWLVAGCLFQTVWNRRAGLPAEAQIKDHDLFYFDPADTSEAAERRTQARVDAAVADLGVPVEAKNQARVHLWYEGWFGFPYPPLAGSRDGIDRFLVRATCVGVRPRGEGIADGLEVYAPHGLEALYEGRLAPNPRTDHRPLFERKVASYRERWPWLTVEGAVERSPLHNTSAPHSSG